jgi:hypothetical protein
MTNNNNKTTIIQESIQKCKFLEKQLKELDAQIKQISSLPKQEEVTNQLVQIKAQRDTTFKEHDQSEISLYSMLFDQLRVSNSNIAQDEGGMYDGTNNPNAEPYGPYIILVLEQVTRVKKHMKYMSNSLISELNNILLDVRAKLWKVTNEKIIHEGCFDPPDDPDFLTLCFQEAVKRKFSGKLAKHAMSEGTKSHLAWLSAKKNKLLKTPIPVTIYGNILPKAVISPLARRLGLVFPIYHQNTNVLLLDGSDMVDDDNVTSANVYAAAILEYVSAELAELLDLDASNNYDVVIMRHQHLTHVLQEDGELNDLINGNGNGVKSAGKMI